MQSKSAPKQPRFRELTLKEKADFYSTVDIVKLSISTESWELI